MIQDKFYSKFIAYVNEHGLFKQNSKILVGFSGGVDSTALINILLHFRKEYNLTLIAAHVNYHLRGEDSNQDERFVKEFCFNNNIPIMVHSVNLLNETNMEAKAREIRMTYFDKIKKFYKIDVIALAHHKYDQAETVLSRFIRGAAFNGLSGIRPKSNYLIHPLLSFSKDELCEYLKEIDCAWREDLSNQDSEYNRNKLRNKLIPEIEKEYNPLFKEKLLDYAWMFSESDKIFKDMAQKAYKKALIFADEFEIFFNLDDFINLSPIIQFYIVKSAWERLSGMDKDFYLTNFKEIKNILLLDGSKEVHLPNEIVFQKDYEFLRFFNRKTLVPEQVYLSREISSLRSIFVFNDKRILMQKLKSLPEEGFPKNSDTVILDLDKIDFPVTLRYRQDGDRFIPFGMKSYKKLKDFFIDEKIPKFQRDKVVLFCDSEKIFWVGEHRLDNRVAVDSETKNYVMFKIEDTKENKTRSAKKKSKKG